MGATTQHTPVPDGHVIEVGLPVGSVEQRRLTALQAVASEASRADTGRPVIATRTFADGCIAVGLGGGFDRPAVHRLPQEIEQALFR